MYQALLILSSLAQMRHLKHGWPHLKRSGEDVYHERLYDTNLQYMMMGGVQ